MLLLLIFVAVVVQSCWPIYNVKADDCKAITGTVTSIIGHENSFDITFVLDDGERYYINRGLEQGLDETTLKEALLGQPTTLYCPRRFSFLANKHGVMAHISRVESNGIVHFSEY